MFVAAPIDVPWIWTLAPTIASPVWLSLISPVIFPVLPARAEFDAESSRMDRSGTERSSRRDFIRCLLLCVTVSDKLFGRHARTARPPDDQRGKKRRQRRRGV